MVGVKSYQQPLNERATGWRLLSLNWDRSTPFFLAALKCFLLVPVCPLLGYYLLDLTGFSHWLVTQGLIPARILGEGFGHVGLCFSIHYVFTGVREFYRALRFLWLPG